MRLRLPAVSAALLGLAAVAGACSDARIPEMDGFVVTADTVDPTLIAPGTVLRRGPATPEAIAGPVYAPVVKGDKGQISIYEGYFLRAPCSRPFTVEATRGDTITVRLRSRPDTTAPDPCPEAPKPIGYSMLVGQFEPGTYAVRLIHEGDHARPSPLDTVYDNITIQPR